VALGVPYELSGTSLSEGCIQIKRTSHAVRFRAVTIGLNIGLFVVLLVVTSSTRVFADIWGFLIVPPENQYGEPATNSNPDDWHVIELFVSEADCQQRRRVLRQVGETPAGDDLADSFRMYLASRLHLPLPPVWAGDAFFQQARCSRMKPPKIPPQN